MARQASAAGAAGASRASSAVSPLLCQHNRACAQRLHNVPPQQTPLPPTPEEEEVKREQRRVRKAERKRRRQEEVTRRDAAKRERFAVNRRPLVAEARHEVRRLQALQVKKFDPVPRITAWAAHLEFDSNGLRVCCLL